MSNYLKIVAFGLLLTACNSEPKVIESVSSAAEDGGSAIIEGLPTATNSDRHEVVVKESLETDKYTYLNVTENDREYWVAVLKRPVEIGATYFFEGGLLKKNFYSREYDRTFETLYLVSELRQQGSSSAVDEVLNQAQGSNALSPDAPINVKPAAGAVKLSELFADKAKYAGKMVKVTGKVVKINPNIMGRNWLHLQDGTGDGLDLTVTTMENIPLGHVVTLEGTIALDKDFGAGYMYDIILEGAVGKN